MSKDDASPVEVANVETVNGSTGGDHLPYVWIIGMVTGFILIAFAIITWAVLDAVKGSGIDAATKGSVIQTWNNLAVAAATFWVGSSLAGKMMPGKDKGK